MKRFRLEQSGRDVVTSHSGLALVGLCINRHTDLAARANEVVPCAGIATADVFRTAVGLLALGQSDFEAATAKPGDRYFREALGIATVPSAETLRQRLDACPELLRAIVADATPELVRRAKAPVAALSTGHVPLDCDVTPRDNSKTHKEGVSYTYKGFTGYAPMGAYLGREGWCLELELRPGSQHAQKGFIAPCSTGCSTERGASWGPSVGSWCGSIAPTTPRRVESSSPTPRPPTGSSSGTPESKTSRPGGSGPSKKGRSSPISKSSAGERRCSRTS
jgi:hypothetical protein